MSTWIKNELAFIEESISDSSCDWGFLRILLNQLHRKLSEVSDLERPVLSNRIDKLFGVLYNQFMSESAQHTTTCVCGAELHLVSRATVLHRVLSATNYVKADSSSPRSAVVYYICDNQIHDTKGGVFPRRGYLHSECVFSTGFGTMGVTLLN